MSGGVVPGEGPNAGDAQKLAIMHGWLVQDVGEHTCAGYGPESGYRHEPTCGYEPLMRVEELDTVLTEHAQRQAIGRRKLTDALNGAVAPREATPGRPEDGPYPGTVGEVAAEVVRWIDHMSDSGTAAGLNRAVLKRLMPPGVLDELRRRRDAYVHDQVSRALADAEGEMSRAQIDDTEIQARLRWDAANPGSARLAKLLGGAR